MSVQLSTEFANLQVFGRIVMNRVLLFFVAVLCLFVGSAFFWFAAKNTPQEPGSVTEVDKEFVPAEKELTEFEFTDQLAQPFNSRQLEGKVWMASFFFASCPSICVQQNAEIAKVHKRFADQDVTILSISVQPEVDVPHVLLQYANKFDTDHSKWKFLTGKKIPYVRQVGADFFSLPAADETHTSDLALFGKDGTMYGPYKVTDPMEQTKLIIKVEELLASDPPSTSEQTSPKEVTQEESTAADTVESVATAVTQES